MAESQTASLEAKIAELTATVAAKDAEIAAAKNELTTRDEQVATLQGDVTKLTTQLGDLTAKQEERDRKDRAGRLLGLRDEAIKKMAEDLEKAFLDPSKTMHASKLALIIREEFSDRYCHCQPGREALDRIAQRAVHAFFRVLKEGGFEIRKKGDTAE